MLFHELLLLVVSRKTGGIKTEDCCGEGHFETQVLRASYALLDLRADHLFCPVELGAYTTSCNMLGNFDSPDMEPEEPET